jgi:hypothetical protein
MEVLDRTTGKMADAMPCLRKHDYKAVVDACRDMRQLEKEADAIYRNAMSALFREASIDPKRLLREKEMLEHIEQAIDHCEHVAKTLANLAVKHG